MSLIYQWSTIANDNGTLGTYPNYWPEGQPPSSVNNCARLMMSSIRTQWNNAQWFDWGYTVAYVSTTSFSVVTAAWNTVTLPAAFETNARIKLIDATTIYGTITTVSASAASTLVTFTPDSGVISAGLTNVFNSILSPTNTAIPSVVTPGSVIPGNNMIVNGDFQVWQRGAGGSAVIALSASTNGAYTADRWEGITSANQASTYSQITGATSGSFLAKVQRNAGQTGVVGSIYIGTSLTRDMCAGAAGNVLSLQFKAKAGADFSAAGAILEAVIYTGTGSSDVSGLANAFVGSLAPLIAPQALTGSLVEYKFTSSALAANVTQVAVQFSFAPVGTAGADDSFYVTDVQLEISPQATAFQRLNFNEQLNNCLPFYEKSFPYSTSPASATGTGSGEWQFNQVFGAAHASQFSGTVPFKAIKFKTPLTPVIYNPAAAGSEVRNATNATDCSATSPTTNGLGSLILFCTTAGGSSIGDVLSFHWTAESELT